MPSVEARACTILAEYNKAQTELIGKAVILTDGKAGTMACEFLSRVTKTGGWSQQ